MKANEIVKKFCKGQECDFWLTKKQAGWLADQFNWEHPDNDDRRSLTDTFNNADNEILRWTLAVAPNGAGLFKVYKPDLCEPKKSQREIKLDNFFKSKGFNNIQEIIVEQIRTGKPLMENLMLEFIAMDS